MANRIIAKPNFAHGGGGFIFPTQGQYQIKDRSGNVVEQGFAGGPMGEGGVKVQSHLLASGQVGNGYSLSFNGHDYNFNGDPGQRFEFDVGNPDPALVGDKGAYGTGGGGMPFGGVSGGGSSGISALPFYLSGFPQFQPINYRPVNFGDISAAPFTFTDPTKFGKDFGAANAEQIKGNFETGKDFAQEALDAELKGLQGFVPGAANIQRGEVTKDNAANQAERTAQVDSVLPDARNTFASLRGSLRAQAGRAATYASGQLPDSVQDRAMELGVRSSAADTASFGGFGARSGEARKASDLMSAEQRFQIEQYGEGLTDQNAQAQQQLIGNEASLELAPTEYSNAGSQVKVTPEVGAGRLTFQGAGMLNDATLLSPAAALSATVSQNEFGTNLDQSTRQFNAEGNFRAESLNAQNALTADEFNSTNLFTAGLGQFNYNTGYLAQLQGANQGNLNAAFETGIAGINANTYNSGMAAGQTGNTIASLGTAIGGISGAVQGITNLFGSGKTDQPQNTSPSGTNTTAAAPATSATDTGKPVQPLSLDPSVPNGFKFPNPASVPAGYTTVAQNSDGSVTAIKSTDHTAQLARFADFTGDSSVPPDTVASASAAADRSLANSAGLSFSPTPGFKKIGLTASGKDVYALPSVASNGNYQMGQDSLLNVGHMLASLGSTDTGMLDAIGALAGHAGNAAFHSQLDHLSDTKGAKAVGQAIVSTLAGKVDAKSQTGAQINAGAMQIGQMWSNLSPAQKSMALMSLAGPIIQEKTGKTVGSSPVYGSDKSVMGELNAGEVMDFTRRGANGYSLARNWNDHSAIGGLVGASTKDGAAEISQALGLTGFGPQGAVVPVTAQQLKATGGAPAPEFGVGALAFSTPKAIPQGYRAATTTPDGKVIAVPQAHLATSTVGNKDTIEPLAYKKTRQIAGNSHPAQSLWGEPPSRDVIRGAVGGSALLAGLHTMADKTPYLFSAVAAHSMFANMMGD